ncbi:MAG: hypothetical protein FJZ01_16310 [Candidatus Sericytochromatia bacterium]|nr:hypothetical protein [Candidatus Tanganyikabacteria bacterium]
MATLLIIANDRALNDSLNLSLLYGGPQGLLEPAMVSRGAVIDTFGGPMRVAARATHFEPRRMKFSGLIGTPGGNADGHLDLYQRAHDAFRTIQGRPARIQIGSLVLDAAFGQLSFSGITDNPRVLGWSLDAEAVPATFGALYGYAVGIAQGVQVVDDRRDHASLKYTTIASDGSVFKITSPASAATEIGLVLSGLTAGTTYYIANSDPRSLPVCFTSSSTWHYLPPGSSLVCWPGGPGNPGGVNTFRIQSDSAGTLASPGGTFVAAVAPHVTIWRFLGNDGNRFGDGPAILTHFRRAKATCCSGASGTNLATAGDVAARTGTALGGYTAAAAGLVLEGQATNLIQYPEAIGNAYWTKTRCAISGTATAPDGSNSMNGIIESADTDTHFVTRTGVFSIAQQACIKFFAKASNRAWVVAGFDITDDDEIAYFNISTGTVGTTGSQVSARIYDWGGGIYLCCVFTASAPGTDVVIGSASADATKSFAGNTGFTAFYLWGVDAKTIPFPDSYTPNPDALPGGKTRHADHAAIHRPHNYLKDSYDQTDGAHWSPSGTGSAQPTRAGTGADGNTACTWTIDNTDITDQVTVSAGASPQTLTVTRKADGGVQSGADINVGNVWDGALHTFKIQWEHYTLNGTRYMYLKLDVDGSNKWTSSNLASAAVSWSADERLWISRGEVYSVIRDLTLGAVPVSSLPTGAIPAIPE